MTDIYETRLPGVGIRFDFRTQSGERVVVVNHHSGRVELMRYPKDGPEECHEVMRLGKDDAKALAEVLGQSRVTEDVTRMQLSMEGLTIDWLSVEAESVCQRCTLYDVEHHDDEAASIVAVVRDGKTNAAPPSTFELRPGDVVVVVGTPEGVAALARLLQAA